ncbi:hypothetical protein FVE67_03880 [Thermosulfurimonas marina]|uniref:Branched-chain amino acid ATP-binding cassette transporter C-terminal domain-containing protein n=2 Tax=Thermosulfurimonas marina TaxID=2047767 RepID=A0A6H1WS77_9BACT|nr:hypothetical protein FVE67_03880 [Thermosulfurimonas marina]
MSVLENVLCGFHLRRQTGFLSALLHLPRALREEVRNHPAVLEAYMGK